MICLIIHNPNRTIRLSISLAFNGAWHIIVQFIFGTWYISQSLPRVHCQCQCTAVTCQCNNSVWQFTCSIRWIRKKDVTPARWQWSYVSLAPTHRIVLGNKNIDLHHSIISRPWEGVGDYNRFSWKRKTSLFYVVNTMVGDDLTIYCKTGDEIT